MNSEWWHWCCTLSCNAIHFCTPCGRLHWILWALLQHEKDWGGKNEREKAVCLETERSLAASHLHMKVSGLWQCLSWSPSWQKGRRGAPVGWSVGFPLPFSHLVVLESSRWGRAQAGLRALWGPQWQSLAVSVSMRTWVEFIQNFLCTCGCSVL